MLESPSHIQIAPDYFEVIPDNSSSLYTGDGILWWGISPWPAGITCPGFLWEPPHWQSRRHRKKGKKEPLAWDKPRPMALYRAPFQLKCLGGRGEYEIHSLFFVCFLIIQVQYLNVSALWRCAVAEERGQQLGRNRGLGFLHGSRAHGQLRERWHLPEIRPRHPLLGQAQPELPG